MGSQDRTQAYREYTRASLAETKKPKNFFQFFLFFPDQTPY